MSVPGSFVPVVGVETMASIRPRFTETPFAVSRLVQCVNRCRLRLDDLRVREHLRRTERALRRATPDDLDAAARERRERALGRLRAYWQREEFPRNPTDGRTPYFVGTDGTDCAVGLMVRGSGAGDLTDSVGRSTPALRVEDINDPTPGSTEAALAAWVEDSALTREEIERIQPAYIKDVALATDCGPIPCALALALCGLASTATLAGAEYAGYRLLGKYYPEKPTKRYAGLAYVTAMALTALPLLTFALYALFP